MSAEALDTELVQKTLNGDREAFAVLYDRYARLVRAVVASPGRDWSAVEDLAQESFLRAYRQLRTLRDPSRFAAWLTGIARQIVREQARVRRAAPLEADQLPAMETARSVETADECEYMLALVARLPDDERLAVHAFFLNEQDVSATAAVLNRSRSGAYAILQRAVGRLARWFGVPEPAEEATK